MKKIAKLFILIIFLIIIYVGCSTGTIENKKDALPREIKGKLNEETLNEEGEKPFSLEMNVGQLVKSDGTLEAKDGVYDLEKVYEFIYSQHPQFNINDFNMWTANFYDLDSDGKDEVIFTTSYGKGRLEEAIVIKAIDGGFIEIPSYMPLTRYENILTFEEGFLVHIGQNGLPGSFEQSMDLYIYDGFRIVNLLDGAIIINKEVSIAGKNYTVTSKKNGNFKDFTMTYFKTDYLTGLEEILSIDHYTYNEGMYYWRTPLSLSNSAKDFDKVYNGSNLLATIEYFNENLYHFDEIRRREFSVNLINVLEKDMERIFRGQRSILEHIGTEGYDVKTNRLDDSNLSNDVIEELHEITSNSVYRIAKKYYTSLGYIEDMGFTITIEPRIFEMLKPALDYAYPERFTPYDYSGLKPILVPNVIFNSPKQVELLPMVYPNVYVYSYADVKKLKGAETWKTNIILPIIIPPPETKQVLKALIIILGLVIIIIGYLLIKSLRKLIDTKKLLEKSIREKEKFMADISHDLKTPIMSIMGYMDTILDTEMRDKIPIDNYLRRTQSNILYISRLVDDLFTMSKLENNQIKLNRKKTNINKVIEEAIIIIENTADKKGISIISQLEATIDSQWEIDYIRIRQVLVNILHNAVKHTSIDGEIIITTKHSKDKKILVAINDSGSGISTEEIPHVFDRYYRSNNNIDSQSTGLGLCIAKELVKKHGGNIWVESELDKGTTFYFEI
ncbi:signal transduction histidine kinase [Natranaerovirga pectinivora]|uniref:histidine kinase n=1 Tax=Natranaerovirga pectinivora TaxID=682400 RepID=A0A4R3MM73_9FIRM|nr:HAMP domain-containing sensor histidine kinase [Natranaerovirga pectinivora]TCT16029.1 signal transduction histidine kinase [Natranaerovirga pectinivora]